MDTAAKPMDVAHSSARVKFFGRHPVKKTGEFASVTVHCRHVTVTEGDDEYWVSFSEDISGKTDRACFVISFDYGKEAK